MCDEDVYLRELVRYIHLNPLRARLVRDMDGLDGYRWSGHSALMGTQNMAAQDRDFVLSYFGKKEGAAKKAYREYVSEGITAGHRPELVGGGLVRSLGGWSEVKSIRKHGEYVLSDERILGSGDFVDRIIREAEKLTQWQYSVRDRKKKIAAVVAAECEQEGIAVKDLQSGGRRPAVSQVRKHIVKKLYEGYGIPLAEIARQTGVSTSAISKVVAAG